MLLKLLFRTFFVFHLESADVRWTAAALWEYLRSRPKVVALAYAASRQSRAQLKRGINTVFPF